MGWRCTKRLHVRSLCEQLRHVCEGLELQSVARGIEEKHGGLLTNFALEPDIGIDFEIDVCGDQAVAKGFPCVQSQNDTKVWDGDGVAIDLVVMCVVRQIWVQMSDYLMSVQVEVNPLITASALGQSEKSPIELAGLG